MNLLKYIKSTTVGKWHVHDVSLWPPVDWYMRFYATHHFLASKLSTRNKNAVLKQTLVLETLSVRCLRFSSLFILLILLLFHRIYGQFNELFFSSIFNCRFAEICFGKDRVVNRNEDHVRHLVQLVCPVMGQLIRVHRFQWVPSI